MKKIIIFTITFLLLSSQMLYAEKPIYENYNALATKTIRVNSAADNLLVIFKVIESQINLYQQIYQCNREAAYNKISEQDAEAYFELFDAARDEMHAAADDYPEGR